MRGSLGCGERFLQSGESLVSTQPVVVRTVLGSCVAMCLWEPGLRLGGINHYVLPRPLSGEVDGGRFGSTACSALIAELLRRGAEPARLQCALFGGGQPVGGLRSVTVGQDNRDVAVEVLARHGIAVAREETGGECGRCVRFHIPTGRTIVRAIPPLHSMRTVGG